LRQRVLGPEHSDTLKSMRNLATVYSYDGKYAQAEVLDNQTLEIFEQQQFGFGIFFLSRQGGAQQALGAEPCQSPAGSLD